MHQAMQQAVQYRLMRVMCQVGHNALGAGRVFDQGAKLVQNAMDDGSFKGTERKTGREK